MNSTPSFMLGAPCSRIDPEFMFPMPTDVAGIEGAKAICGPCPARTECLEWALDPARRCDFGVFGGLTEDERRGMAKARGKALRLYYGRVPAKSQRISAATAA